VLDVGCGTGLFLDHLAREHRGLELTGLDLSAEMLDQARRRTRDARFVQGSVYELPFADASFDVALNTISCHFYLEQVRAFAEIRRVLRPGGRFLCAAVAWRPLLFGPELAGVAVYHPREVLEAHLRAAGFTVRGIDRLHPGVVVFDAEAV
jgi:ubiquinone/menaquinone biosynthesis C-methylase UbiE